MLAIERELSHKNRLLLSGLAVIAGFAFTVGIISAINPAEDSTNQSTQTSSERRATSLIPINASDSETSSESDKTGSPGAPETTKPSASGSSSATATLSPSQQSSTPTKPAQPASSDTSTSSGGNSGGTVLDPITCLLLGC